MYIRFFSEILLLFYQLSHSRQYKHAGQRSRAIQNYIRYLSAPARHKQLMHLICRSIQGRRQPRKKYLGPDTIFLFFFYSSSRYPKFFIR